VALQFTIASIEKEKMTICLFLETCINAIQNYEDEHQDVTIKWSN